MTIVEDKICDLDARGSEEADNIANERELNRFIITVDFYFVRPIQLNISLPLKGFIEFVLVYEPLQFVFLILSF